MTNVTEPRLHGSSHRHGGEGIFHALYLEKKVEKTLTSVWIIGIQYVPGTSFFTRSFCNLCTCIDGVRVPYVTFGTLTEQLHAHRAKIGPSNQIPKVDEKIAKFAD